MDRYRSENSDDDGEGSNGYAGPSSASKDKDKDDASDHPRDDPPPPPSAEVTLLRDTLAEFAAKLAAQDERIAMDRAENERRAEATKIAAQAQEERMSAQSREILNLLREVAIEKRASHGSPAHSPHSSEADEVAGAVADAVADAVTDAVTDAVDDAVDDAVADEVADVEARRITDAVAGEVADAAASEGVAVIGAAAVVRAVRSRPALTSGNPGAG